MNRKRQLCVLFAAVVGVATATVSGDVEAQKGKKAVATPAPAATPPMTTKPIALTPAGISWGLSMKALTVVYDKMLDEAYKPLYDKVSPGVKMKALDAALEEEKSAFRRSRIDFGKLPTGVDATPLRGEYTYMNGESLMTFTRDGQTRHFFFIKDKLWKIIDERKLGETSPLGKTFQDAAVKLAGTLGVPGRVLDPDPAAGRPTTEIDWTDAATHLRAIDRGGSAMALAYEDNATLANLASLRTIKPANEDEIDPAVAAAVRGQAPSEPPKPKPKKP
jgi:hypothetical protein